MRVLLTSHPLTPRGRLASVAVLLACLGLLAAVTCGRSMADAGAPGVCSFWPEPDASEQQLAAVIETLPDPAGGYLGVYHTPPARRQARTRARSGSGN